MQKIKHISKKVKEKFICIWRKGKKQNESFEALRGKGNVKIKHIITALFGTEATLLFMLINPKLHCLWLFASIVFAGLFISMYFYSTTSRKTKISLVAIILLLCTILTVLLFSSLIIITLLYHIFMNRINMKHISRCFELFLMIASNCLIASLLIAFAVQKENSFNLYVIVFELIVFGATYYVNRFYIWLFYRGQNTTLIRYRINCELNYLGEFLVAIFVLIRHMFSGQLENALFVFVGISYIITIKRCGSKFDKYYRHREYLMYILDDLDDCKELLQKCDAKSKISVKFCFKNIEWLFRNNYKNRKIQQAVNYLQKLIFMPPKGKEKRIYRRRRYSNPKLLCVKITKVQNVIAKALK